MNVAASITCREAFDCQPEREAQAVLRAAPYYALRRVRCSTCEGRLVLHGTVPSYYLKQMAQYLLQRQWSGDLPVENRLEVAPCEACHG